jgi:hypothetical protein
VELFSVKTSFNSSCQDEDLRRRLSAMLPRVRDITYWASVLVNRHMLRLCSENVPISDLYYHPSGWFFTAAMKMVCGETPSASEECRPFLLELQATFQNFPVTLNLDGSNLWHVLQPQALDYTTNMRNHIGDHLEAKLERYLFHNIWNAVNQTLPQEEKVTISVIWKSVHYVMKRLQGTEIQFPDLAEDIPDALKRNIKNQCDICIL